ncbi:MAG: selenide, water dikinase SelD [Symploca sp. SIO1C2]|nr:selenide, water dikinase SelD [Symploca sp. SIO1C2]
MQQTPHPITTDLVLVGGGHSHAIALYKFAMKPIPGVRLTLITDTAHTPYSGMLPGYVAGFYSYDETHIDLRRLAVFAKARLYLDQAIGLDLTENKVICAHHPPVAFDYLSLDIGSTPATIGTPGAAEYAIPAKPVPWFLAAWEKIVTQVEQCPTHPLSLAIVGGGAGGVELALNMQARLQQILTDAGQSTEKLEIHLCHRGTQLLPYHNRWVSRYLEKILWQRGIKLHLGERVSQIRVSEKRSGETSQQTRRRGDAETRRMEMEILRKISFTREITAKASNSLPKLEASQNCTNLSKSVICNSGLTIPCHQVFWVTQASAPSWIQASGLATDERGFVLVADTLQSISHPHIFAAGDIATMQNYQRPKAGVFAVRQGKPLFDNLQRMVLGKKLLPYRPQAQYLSLIGTGDKKAIASWSFFGWHSPLLWQWKDHIDRKFMAQFDDLYQVRLNTYTLVRRRQKAEGRGQKGRKKVAREKGIISDYPNLILPSMVADGEMGIWGDGGTGRKDIIPEMYCAGCGAKVGSKTLEKVLRRLSVQEKPNIIIGLDNPDDAAVVQVPPGQLLVQTVDYFRSLTDDPYIFGQIATNHCLSDIFAMGATPQSALAIATIPYSTEDKIEETLYQLMSGANKILQDSQASLIGGHTSEGAQLAFGLSCNGLVTPQQLLRKSGMKPGQGLILTKAIGTGTLFAADMRYQAKGRWIEQAIASMLLSNQTAAQVFLEYGATACTDITGFGLLGHLVEMVKASQVGVELDMDAIPILPGARETIQAGITSSLHPQNLRLAIYLNNATQVSDLVKYQLLFDPQTSGGLLGAIPAENVDECLNKLKISGHKQSCLIGKVISTPEELRIKN